MFRIRLVMAFFLVSCLVAPDNIFAATSSPAAAGMKNQVAAGTQTPNKGARKVVRKKSRAAVSARHRYNMTSTQKALPPPADFRRANYS